MEEKCMDDLKNRAEEQEGAEEISVLNKDEAGEANEAVLALDKTVEKSDISRNESLTDENRTKTDENLTNEALSAQGSKDSGANEDGDRKSRLPGYILVGCAVFLAVLAGWMRLNIMGTRLLYIDLWTGHICRYYWLPLAVAVALLAAGYWQLKRGGREAGSGAGMVTAENHAEPVPKRE